MRRTILLAAIGILALASSAAAGSRRSRGGGPPSTAFAPAVCVDDRPAAGHRAQHPCLAFGAALPLTRLQPWFQFPF